MVFVKTLTGRTLCIDSADVFSIKQQIQNVEGIPSDEQRLIFAGHQLEDNESVEKDATVFLSLSLLGGAKKRKKKVYTTPKKNKRKPKKVKLAVLKYYKIDDSGNVTRLRRECQQSTCGGGVFMAKHSNRHYCGRCHDTLVESAPAPAQEKGKKGKK